MDRLYVSAGAIALTALIGWQSYMFMAAQSGDPFAACRGGAVGGALGGPMTLIDENGATTTDAELLAKPALIYFGYASCPDVCPLDNARNAEAADLLAAQGLDLTPIFISVDPTRDTPEILREYTDNFSPRLLGLTGSDAQIKLAAQAYKVYYNIPDHQKGDAYTVDHTTLTYLMLPSIGFADFFERDTTAQDVAKRVSCFLQSS